MELVLGLDPLLEPPGAGAEAVIGVAAAATAAGIDGFHATFRFEGAVPLREPIVAAIRTATRRPLFVETLAMLSSIRPLFALRPDAILLGPERREEPDAVLDPTLAGGGIESALEEARAGGFRLMLRVGSTLAAVRASHRLGAGGVFFPLSALESGDSERIESFDDAVRGATKLRMRILAGPATSGASIERAARHLPSDASLLLGRGLLSAAVELGLPAAVAQARSRTGR
jgi:pyridoxine 5'-phosphate synthase PdxJ